MKYFFKQWSDREATLFRTNNVGEEKKVIALKLGGVWMFHPGDLDTLGPRRIPSRKFSELTLITEEEAAMVLFQC